MAFCNNCGKQVDDKAVVCVYCGVETPLMSKEATVKADTPIIINNSSSSSSSAAATSGGGGRRHYSIIFDIFMIFFTGGLWIIWMILRPKYY